MPYDVKDISLAPQGKKKIEWVQKHMPVLEHIKKEFEKTKPFEGITIASCLHLEPKTINLGLTLQAGGAEVAMTGCNPLSTHDDATAAGAALGLNMYGWRGENNEEYYQNIHKVLDHNPDILIDDGADMIFLVHRERKELLTKIKGACEETTTGIHRLKSMAADNALKFPVMAVNDAYTKYMFDNRYGTGQSTFDSIMGATNMLIAGKTIVVCGYGWCGRGISMRALGLGGNVIVTEIDPIRALEAKMDGFRVMTIREAVKHADILLTVTGNIDVVSGDDFKYMKDGCVMANSGHFNVEINQTDLRNLSISEKKVKEDIDEFKMEDGRSLFLL
ncbi:MAG: adenosylhomocysteinase, partial [Methanobacteriaceae archaeon]|nr:adenosylhomocysteinase [Methanobacteriaceae archaeon]